MKTEKRPIWLILTAVLAVVFGNAAVIMLIFQIRGLLFLPVLLLYAAILCVGCAWLLRKRELQRLSAELQVTEEEVRDLIRKAKKQERKNS